MSILSMALLLQAGAPAADPAPQDAPAIIVTARRFDETAKALAECVDRKCPPDEEVKAALAHAENLFLAGDYRGARRTLLDSIGRVDRHAKAYPVPVSTIWRAESRIAAHLGEREAMQGGQFQAIDALKAGLRSNDERILLQRLEVADSFAKQGKLAMARAGYNKVVDQAGKLGAHFVRGTAMLRLAILATTLASLDEGGANFENPDQSVEANRIESRRALGAILATTEPELASFREAATLLQARFEAKSGDMSAIDRLAQQYAAKKPSQAVLLYAPQIDQKGSIFDRSRDGSATAAAMSTADFEGQWADVTFLIAPDGTVRDAEVLRESPQLRGKWLEPVLGAIAGRRYAPIYVPPGLDGMRRVERYTLTSFKRVPTGSRMRVHGGPRLEMLDLTADPDVKKGSTS